MMDKEKNIYSCIEQEDGPGPCKCNIIPNITHLSN